MLILQLAWIYSQGADDEVWSYERVVCEQCFDFSLHYATPVTAACGVGFSGFVRTT